MRGQAEGQTCRFKGWKVTTCPPCVCLCPWDVLTALPCRRSNNIKVWRRDLARLMCCSLRRSCLFNLASHAAPQELETNELMSIISKWVEYVMCMKYVHPCKKWKCIPLFLTYGHKLRRTLLDTWNRYMCILASKLILTIALQSFHYQRGRQCAKILLYILTNNDQKKYVACGLKKQIKTNKQINTVLNADWNTKPTGVQLLRKTLCSDSNPMIQSNPVQWFPFLHNEKIQMFSQQTRKMSLLSRPLKGFLRMHWLVAQCLCASVLDGRDDATEEQHYSDSLPHETRHLFVVALLFCSARPPACALLFMFANTLVTSVETITLLNQDPTIGCAPAARVRRSVAITHRKESLADLMAMFGCRGRRWMTATSDDMGLKIIKWSL